MSLPLRVEGEDLTLVDEAGNRDDLAGRTAVSLCGKPAALVIGVEGEDLEDLLTMGNPRFWEMIEDRRRTNRSATLAEVRARYGVLKPARRRPKRARARKV